MLRLLPPERAHRAAIRLLPLLPAAALPAYPRLRTRLAGLELAHPLGLAAGFDKDGEAPLALLRQGFSTVEVGTVTPRPQLGNPLPRLFRLSADEALINRRGFNNAGLDAMAARLERLGPRLGVVGANIGMNRDAADPVADYQACLRRVYPLVDYITVNVSSPNTPGLRALQQEERLRPLLDGLLTERERLTGAAGRRPILLKVSPDLDEAGEEAIASVVDDFRIDGLIVGNTTVSRPSDLRSRTMAETGGLSGRPLLLLSTRLLARFTARLGKGVTLVAAGGVSSGADAYEKVRAGASVVQIYTGLVYRGLGIVRTVLDELEACLARDGFATLADAVGRDSGDSRP